MQSRPLTAHFHVNPTMTNIWRLLVPRLLVWWFPFWQFVVWVCLLRLIVTGLASIGWFIGVGPVSCHLHQILLQQVSGFLAAVLGKRVLRRWVRQLQFGSCWIQAASGTPSRHLSPQVSPRPQNPALPHPMRGKPRVCPCRSRQTLLSNN